MDTAVKLQATEVVFPTSHYEDSLLALFPVMQESSTQENICFYSGDLVLYTGVIAYVCVICAPVAVPISLISTAVSFITC